MYFLLPRHCQCEINIYKGLWSSVREKPYKRLLDQKVLSWLHVWAFSNAIDNFRIPLNYYRNLPLFLDLFRFIALTFNNHLEKQGILKKISYTPKLFLLNSPMICLYILADVYKHRISIFENPLQQTTKLYSFVILLFCLK